MTNQKVLLLGATGETGGSILTGLLDYGKFEITVLIRPSSADKPKVKGLVKRGVKILIADVSSPLGDLAPLLSGFDIFISAISALSLLAQINVATAAKKAGFKRFVPCGFATICPPGGVMLLRDELSVPRLPSGRIDKYIFPDMNTVLHVDGKAPNLLTDLRDIGYFVAKIVDDERTLNRYIYAWGSVLAENEVYSIIEELSGEKLERKFVSAEEMEGQLSQARHRLAKEPENKQYRVSVYSAEYDYSKYVRMDNKQEYAKYLGYLDASELYPGFEARGFREFFRDLLDGRVGRPYEGLE